MRKILTIIFFSLLIPNSINANPIKANWVVRKAIVSSVFLKTEDTIGKEQFFSREKSEGVFFNCPFGAGEVSSYTTYNYDEFINNKQFKIFKQNIKKLNFPINNKIYVEKLTCADNKSVLYPFIQFENSDIAFYEFGLGIYQLNKKWPLMITW